MGMQSSGVITVATNPRVPFELSTHRQNLAGPSGKPLIVKFDVNIEHWPFSDPLPRRIISAPHGRDPDPDVANFSWHEYGQRCGMPRLFRLFGERNLPVDCLINASAIDAYPGIAERALELGWEFVGHGYKQRSIQREDDARDVIERSLSKLRSFSGQPVHGWLGAGLHETHDTPELLKDAGIEYLMDWVLDDLPCWFDTANGRLMCMPYSLELNDAVITATEKHASTQHYDRIKDTVAVFEDELATQPRVLAIPLHPYISGVPHRFLHLTKAVDMLMNRSDTVFMNAGQIAQWFVAVDAGLAQGEG